MGNVYIDQLKQRKTFFMTKGGIDNLRKKLDTLMRDRLETVKRIRSMTNDDGTDSMTLVDEVRCLEATEIEVANISNILQCVEPIVKTRSPQHVQIGSEVTLESGSRKVSYMIVCALEIDLETNKISEDSPLGGVLLGRKLHDIIAVPTRKDGTYTYKIIDIM
jgi:transcription elongation factor GreA